MAAALYALGSNASGQLGIGHLEDVSVPKEVMFDGESPPPGPILIRAGGNHTLLLSASGQLYCSKDFSNYASASNLEESSQISKFRQVKLPDHDATSASQSKVAYCAATWEASIVVKYDTEGNATQVYAFGVGGKGELGLGEFIFKTSKAQLIKDFPPPGTEVVDLAACVGHVVAVLSNGDVYGWGNGRKGQLGKPHEVVHSPRKISDITFRATRAVCGREFTFLASIFGGGQQTFLGADKWGIKSSIAAQISGWRDVAAGWGNIFTLDSHGKVSSWGRNDHGQLAPQGLPIASQIAVGSEHAVMLSSTGDVIAWGWGEHGNCGPITSNGDLKGKWNIIASTKYLPAGSKILSVGAGCATSWIFVGSP